MPEAVIVATARTPIGRAFKGSLTSVRADDMSAFIIRSLLDKVPAVDPSTVDDVIWGAANHVGQQSMNLARNVSMLAGLPDTVPATTVNRFCASSLQSMREVGIIRHRRSTPAGPTMPKGYEWTSRVTGSSRA